MLDALRIYFHGKLPLTETCFSTLAGQLTPRRLAKGALLRPGVSAAMHPTLAWRLARRHIAANPGSLPGALSCSQSQAGEAGRELELDRKPAPGVVFYKI